MLVYSDLTFTGNANALAELLRRLDNVQPGGLWVRDQAAEDQLGAIDPGPAMRCYKSQVEEIEARLWLTLNATEWEVTNIVPEGRSQLTPEEYYSLLLSFRETLLQLAAGLPIRASEPVLDLAPSGLLSEKGYKLLKTFSSLANKSTGIGHPRDQQRWNAFMIELHRRGIHISADDLQRVLVEHENWPAKQAAELAVLFESQQSLLSDLAKTA